MLVISADLPFAQDRFCSTEGLSNVVPLSMMRSRSFAKDYGVLMVDGPLAGICARAVVVLDEHDHVLHAQLVDEITTEPDYDMMQEMSSLMNKGMDAAHMNQMSGIMGEMSKQMMGMSGMMKQGQVPQKDMQQLRQRMMDTEKNFNMMKK